MAKQARFHMSLRVDPITAQRIEALRGQGETITSIYNKTLAAGVEVLEHPQEAAQEAREAESELVAALREHIATLSQQLTVKDEQLMSLGDNLRAAQQLHGADKQQLLIEPATVAKTAQEAPQEAPQPEHSAREGRPSLFARVFGRWA